MQDDRSEELPLEGFVPPTRALHERLELRFAANVFEERIDEEVGMGKEPILYAVAKHAQRRSSIPENGVRLRDLVARFRIAYPVLLDPVFQLIQDPQTLRIMMCD
jgi:hypothetical protein